jgi:DnaJ-class molecular chaperone
MDLKDYYKILGVERTASSREIKEAYLRMIRKYHPDINPEQPSLTNFHDVVEAYQILGDLENRLHYSFVMSQNRYNRIKWVRRFNLPVSVND